MESEKVKEIKDRLQEELDYGLKTNGIASPLVSVELLNTTLALINELEKENKNKTDTITDLLKKQEFYEKEKLTKLTEKLKESASQHYVSQNGVRISDITYSISDSTINKILKEFMSVSKGIG